MKKFSPALIAMCLLCLPLAVAAQKLEIEPSDETLVIKAWIGEDGSFAGDVRVTLRSVAKGTAALKLSALPSNLKRADGLQIPRQQVQVTETQLTPDLVTSVPIKINGVKDYGEYTGTIELLLAGQPREQGKTIKVTLKAEKRSTLSLLSASIKKEVVNCSSPCWLADLLLPAYTQNSYELHFDKPAGAALTVAEMSIDVRGEQTGFQLTTDHLNLGQAKPNGIDNRFINIPVTVTSSALPADHYVGSVLLSVDPNNPAVKVPVDVSVRVAPLWPLLFLVAGILLGKVTKYMQEKGSPAADALISLNRVELRVEEAHAEDQAILADQMQEARRLIKEDQAPAATALTKLIDTRLATLNELRTIQSRLAGKEEHATVVAIIDQIKKVRVLTGQGKDDQVKELVDAIQASLVALATTMMGENDQPDPKIKEASGNADAAATAANRSATMSLRSQPAQRSKLRLLLASFSGIKDEWRAEASLWVLRPLLWIVLLLSLIALGMKSLYIDNPIFGVSCFDYLSLVFWGLSSDVASRTLGGLKVGE